MTGDFCKQARRPGVSKLCFVEDNLGGKQ